MMKDPLPIIGIDESGKGDYFGPLVTGAVYVDEKTEKVLEVLGVKDSKTLTDKKIKSLATEIKATCPHSIVKISNKKYNELFDKMKNLNKILAWSHARVLENVLEAQACKHALSDQFGKKERIESVLMEKGREITLHQRTKAESNIAVAAASILARAAFVDAIFFLGRDYDIELPKGASQKTIDMGKLFVAKYSKEKLQEVAKCHFKTTQKILA